MANISSQKGVSLIIVFLIMTIVLAIVLGLTLVVFRKVTIISDLGTSQSAFNSANSGIEKTLYFDRKQIPPGATRGFCNLCSACPTNDCLSCSLTELSAGGCDSNTCNNCRLNYASAFDLRTFRIDATITPSTTIGKLDLYILSEGMYRNAQRVLEFRETK